MLKHGSRIFITILAVCSAILLWQQTKLLSLALTRTDPLPKTEQLIAEEHYAEAAAYLGFFMDFDYVKNDPRAQALYTEIEDKRTSWRYRAAKLGEGLWSGTSDETIGQLAGVTTDFFLIGDIRDLAIEGVHLAKGEEVDEVLVALASLGVVASGAQVASAVGTASTAGAASPTLVGSTAAKSGLITLKVARKIGKLPAWLGKAIVKAAKAAKQTKSLGALSNMLGDLTTLSKIRGGLELLSKTDDVGTLSRMAKFGQHFGDQSIVLYRIGRDYALRAAEKVGKAGLSTVKEAATYGEEGLKLLDQVGIKKFNKILAARKVGKMLYKGDLVKLLAKLLLKVPKWLLMALIAFAIVLWLPRPLSRYSRKQSAHATTCYSQLPTKREQR